MRVEHLTDIELQGWLTLFWMGQDGQDVVLREEWDLDVRSSASDVLDGVARLCARHEILRSNFGIDSSGDPVRMVTDPIDFTPPVTIVDSGSPEFAPEIGGAVSDGRYLWQWCWPSTAGPCRRCGCICDISWRTRSEWRCGARI